MLQSMASFDQKDSTSSRKKIPNFLDFKNIEIKGKKIGIPKEYLIDGLNSEIRRVWDQGINWFKSEGAEIVDISLPHTNSALPAYYIIAPAEASANLARYEESGMALERMKRYKNSRKNPWQRIRKEVKRRLMIGTCVLSAGYYDAYYLKALKVRKLISNDFEEVFVL